MIPKLKDIKAMIANLQSSKVDKVAGKSLSTNDYTNDEKTKLSGLSNYTLPVATSSTLGGIKQGDGLVVDGNGSTNISWLKADDLRSNLAPINIPSTGAKAFFTSMGGLDSHTTSGEWTDVLALSTWSDTGGGKANAIAFEKGTTQRLWHYRGTFGASTWSDKKQIAYTDSSITPNSVKTPTLKVNNTYYNGGHGTGNPNGTGEVENWYYHKLGTFISNGDGSTAHLTCFVSWSLSSSISSDTDNLVKSDVILTDLASSGSTTNAFYLTQYDYRQSNIYINNYFTAMATSSTSVDIWYTLPTLNGLNYTFEGNGQWIPSDGVDYADYSSLSGVLQPSSFYKASMQPTVIYNNAAGSNGTITLSQYVTNFSHIVIYWISNDGYNGSKIVKMNSHTSTDLVSFQSLGGTGSVFIKIRVINTNGTTISTLNTRTSEVQLSTSISINGNNNISIVEVDGY